MDGNTGTDINSPCTHTTDNYGAGASNPWWMVDLGTVEPVSELYIVNRGSCCGDRLSKFEIRIGECKITVYHFDIHQTIISYNYQR